MDTVVLAHGLWMPREATWMLSRRLESEGFGVHRFSYSSVGRELADNAAQLAAFLEGIEGSTLHLVGHSLGGVVILSMLERYGLERPGRVVCLGSPLAGSRAAMRLAGQLWGRRLLGKCMSALLESPFTAWTGKREVGVIAGNQPYGLGHLFTHFEGPHDGTVAVEETRLPGVTDHIVLPVSHLSMLWSQQVAQQVGCFLHEGRFVHRSLISAASS